MEKNKIIGLVCLFVVLSAGYTIYDYFQKEAADKEKYKSYIQAKAIVYQKSAPRVSRYGTKAGNYIITIVDAQGKESMRANCDLGGAYEVNDTLTVYYDPNKATSEVVTEIPK